MIDVEVPKYTLLPEGSVMAVPTLVAVVTPLTAVIVRGVNGA